jgi:anti-sigma B factor antagonist
LVTGDEAVWQLDVDPQSERVVLRVCGDLDLETAPRLLAGAEPHLDTGDGGLVIDLSEVTFIDSSGLSVLIRINQRVTAANRRLAIIAPPPHVAKAFEITGLNQVLPLRSHPA